MWIAFKYRLSERLYERLSGWIFGIIATIFSLIIFIVVGLYVLIVKYSNMSLFYAALTGLATMLGFILLIYIDDKGWIYFRNSRYAVIAPVWIFMAVLFAIIVYIKNINDSFDEVQCVQTRSQYELSGAFLRKVLRE
jgi:hypothetical protein